MRKKIIIAITLMIIGSIVVAGILVSNNPYFKVCLYQKDRITGSFAMTVNGNEYNPIKESLEYENNGTQRLNENGKGDFSIKGGKYGLYKIAFYINNSELAELTNDKMFEMLPKSTPIIFAYFNKNWWNITVINLNAELIYENDEWVLKLRVNYTELNEDGSKPTEMYQKLKVNYFDEVKKGKIMLQFGI